MPFKSNHIVLLTLLIITGYACKKGSIETDYNPNIQVANNQVIAERAYSQVFNIFFMVATDPELKELGTKEIFGANCSYQETPEIKYVIDFLHYYTLCPDGKVRKGVITAILDKDFSEPSAVAGLTFSDYTVDELRLEGSNTIINEGLSASMQAIFEHRVPAATITFIDSLVETPYHWESVKTYSYLEGMGTPNDYYDDLFAINGESSGLDIAGVSFSAVTEEALGNYLGCRWIRTGKTLLSIPGLAAPSGYIEYIGEDTCTNLVIYSFNGNPFFDKFTFH